MVKASSKSAGGPELYSCPLEQLGVGPSPRSSENAADHFDPRPQNGAANSPLLARSLPDDNG